MIIPDPKIKPRRKLPVDWTGFAVPKQAVNLGKGHAYSKFKKQVMLLQNYTCRACLKKFKPRQLTIDHVIKRSILRLDTFENCNLLCLPCHMKKDLLNYDSKTRRYYEKGELCN